MDDSKEKYRQLQSRIQRLGVIHKTVSKFYFRPFSTRPLPQVPEAEVDNPPMWTFLISPFLRLLHHIYYVCRVQISYIHQGRAVSY